MVEKIIEVPYEIVKYIYLPSPETKESNKQELLEKEDSFVADEKVINYQK